MAKIKFLNENIFVGEPIELYQTEEFQTWS